MDFGYFTLSDNHYDNNPRSSNQFVADITAEALYAEQLGMHSAWIGEHHFNSLGVLSCPDLVLAYVAARSKRIRLAPAVTVLPLHNPIRVAEQWATLDLLSGGRVDFAAGRGYDRREYLPFHVSFEDNQGIFEEGLELVRKLWMAEGRISHHGRHYSFDDVRITPKPVQRPHPPVTIGGRGRKRTLRTVARWAQQWNAIAQSPAEWRELKEVLAGHCAAIGRDVNEITCSVNVRVDPDAGLEPVVAEVTGYRDAGVGLIIVNLPHHAKPDSLQPLAEALTPLG